MAKYKFLIIMFIAALMVCVSLTISEPVDAQTTSPAAPVATPTPPIDEEEGIIKIDTEAVNVLFTAQDKNRRLLLGLKPEDIQIFENDQPQSIVAFSKQVDLPLSLALLIDTSISQERTLPEEKAAAISFVESVIRAAKDEVAVVSFASETMLELGMTSNAARVRRAVDGVRLETPSGYIGGGVVAAGGIGTPPISGDNQANRGSSAVWDAIWITSEEVLGPAPERTRRAIILISDGVNYGGKKKLKESVEAAQKAEAIIYSIGIGDNYYSGVDKGSLEKVSESTGGRAYFPRDERELRDAFRQIQEEMRSQYLIAYEPTNPALDGSYRKIEIKILNPELQKQKIGLTHRKGYFAKTAKK